MRVIFVHGVSDGPTRTEYKLHTKDPSTAIADPNGYYSRLKQRFEIFASIVTDELDEYVPQDGYTDASWGQLRPLIEDRTRKGDPRFEAFGQATNNLPISPSEPIAWQDYETADGAMDAAAALDAIQLRIANIPDQSRKSIHKSILRLAGEFPNTPSAIPIKVAIPKESEPLDQVLDRLMAAAPPFPDSSFEAFDANAKRSWRQRALDYLQKGSDKITKMRARDWSSRELAKKWADAIWYVGAGRAIVLNKVVGDLEKQSQLATQDEIIVVLGHSLGGLISLEALNSKLFADKKLHEKCKWVLILFGAQISIFHQLGVIENTSLKGHLDRRGRYRNIVDRNDPLGFFVGATNGQEVDVEILSGFNVLDSHSSYFDTPLAMNEARKQIRAIKKDWAKAQNEHPRSQ